MIERKELDRMNGYRLAAITKDGKVVDYVTHKIVDEGKKEYFTSGRYFSDLSVAKDDLRSRAGLTKYQVAGYRCQSNY